MSQEIRSIISNQLFESGSTSILQVGADVQGPGNAVPSLWDQYIAGLKGDLAAMQESLDAWPYHWEQLHPPEAGQTIEAEISWLQEQNAAMDATLRDLEPQDAQDIEAEISRLQEQSAALDATLQDLESKLFHTEDELAKFNRDIAELAPSLEALQALLEQEQSAATQVSEPTPLQVDRPKEAPSLEELEALLQQEIAQSIAAKKTKLNQRLDALRTRVTQLATSLQGSVPEEAPAVEEKKSSEKEKDKTKDWSTCSLAELKLERQQLIQTQVEPLRAQYTEWSEKQAATAQQAQEIMKEIHLQVQDLHALIDALQKSIAADPERKDLQTRMQALETAVEACEETKVPFQFRLDMFAAWKAKLDLWKEKNQVLFAELENACQERTLAEEATLEQTLPAKRALQQRLMRLTIDTASRLLPPSQDLDSGLHTADAHFKALSAAAKTSRQQKEKLQASIKHGYFFHGMAPRHHFRLSPDEESPTGAVPYCYLQQKEQPIPASKGLEQLKQGPTFLSGDQFHQLVCLDTLHEVLGAPKFDTIFSAQGKNRLILADEECNSPLRGLWQAGDGSDSAPGQWIQFKNMLSYLVKHRYEEFLDCTALCCEAPVPGEEKYAAFGFSSERLNAGQICDVLLEKFNAPSMLQQKITPQAWKKSQTPRTELEKQVIDLGHQYRETRITKADFMKDSGGKKTQSFEWDIHKVFELVQATPEEGHNLLSEWNDLVDREAKQSQGT